MSRPRPALGALGIVSAMFAVAAIALAGRISEPIDMNRTEPMRMSTRHARALTEEAIQLYAAGQLARACERLREVAVSEPQNAGRRVEIGRCFEGWGWQALREGRADDAMLLFGQGLRDAPDAPGLLTGLGVSAIHAGHVERALAPLEQAARVDDDGQVRLLLAHLYDRVDDVGAAVGHLRAVLEREPAHPEARRLLDKLERERRVETGFQREETEHFAVRSREGRQGDDRRGLLRLLERAHDQVAAQLGFRPTGRVTVVLYESGDFQAVTGAHGWASGVFDGKIRLPVFGRVDAVRDVDRLVLHEYAHAAIHELSRGGAPRWLHEGLAQVVEGAVVDPMLRVPSSPTLAGVEALVTDSDPVRARAGYDLALWIVSDLLDRGGMERMREVLAHLGAGRPLPDAMASAYGLRLAELESQWRHLLGG